MRIARVVCMAAVAVSCSSHVFICHTDDQCVDGTVQGACESNSYCSFPDPSCPAQRRYGEFAGGDVAGACVDAQNYVANPTCDVDTSHWGPFQSTVSVSTVAHTGDHACLICAAGQPDFTMDDESASVSSAAPGQVYLGLAWVRAAPGSTKPMSVYVELRESTTYRNDTSVLVSVDDTWQQLSARHTVTMTTQPLEIFLAGKQDAAMTNPCFLVDDIALYLEP